jgi:2-hydroxychromene-2-carboxylate isomerase
VSIKLQADWFFDFISPFSYLQWPRVRSLRERLDITPRPIVFGALLDHLRTVGPAETPAKRRFTYRMAMLQARQQGTPLRFPPAHPFNPIAALRLCIAAGTTDTAITQIFDWLWREGRAGDSADALAPLARALGIDDVAAAISAEPVKQALRQHYDLAVERRVFGVPTMSVAGELFWGNDSTALLQTWLDEPEWFASDDMQRLDALPEAVQRRRD